MAAQTVSDGIGTALLARTLQEGYGPGAWHGADFKAAIADVTAKAAFKRPAAERHSIAEIALHHAYCVRNVRGKLTGATLEPFIVDGDDWFPLTEGSRLSWTKIADLVESEQQKLADAVKKGKRAAGVDDAEAYNLVLGITCHAVYHAGQVQLIKKLI
jgi:hypothetical protein